MSINHNFMSTSRNFVVWYYQEVNWETENKIQSDIYV